MSDNLQVVRQNPAQLQISDLRDLFQRAVEKDGVEAIKALQEMHESICARNAKFAFDEAMKAFQMECPQIKKSKAGAQNRYRYAPLDVIVRTVKGLVSKHGFSYTINTSVTPDKSVKATVTVTHEAGHSITADFECPIDDRESNKLMTAPQKYGAATTFAKRYAFTNAFGILTTEEDTDGGAAPAPPSPRLATVQTRNWFIGDITKAGLNRKAHAYASKMGFIQGEEGINDWPLDKIPVTREAAAKILTAISEVKL